MKNHRIKLLFALLFWGVFLPAFAQYFGGFSNKAPWFQLETTYARIIFPAGLSMQANNVANNIDWLIQTQDSSRNFRLRKIDIVLNNQAVESNGYVSSVPYHSMFFLTPPQNGNVFGTTPWLEELTIHEYRHVWQYNQMRSRLANALYWVAGDKGWGGYIHIIFPNWYFEGDAIHSETKFTHSGRGRLPYFSLTQRAMALDSINYKYIKLRNGSYKDPLPNHYEYGYHLVSYGNKQFGESGWNRIIKNTSSLKSFFYPFSSAIKKESGMRAKKFYQAMLKDFSEYTNKQQANRTISTYTPLTIKTKTVSNYYQAVFETDSTLLVLKNSYKEILSLYRLHLQTRKEQKLYEIGYLDNPWFSYANNTVVWSEFRHDKRYWNTGYSIIRKLNLKTLKCIDLTKESRYFSPALSPNGQNIAVIEHTDQQETSLKIIDAITGLEKEKIDAAAIQSTLDNKPKSSEYYKTTISSPCYWNDGSAILFIRKINEKNSLCSYHFASGTLTEYPQNTNFQIPKGIAVTNPIKQGNLIYFSASHQGIDDIFYIDTTTDSCYRATSSKLGAYYPAISPNGKSLVFSNYSLYGFKLAQMDLPTNPEKLSAHTFEKAYYSSEIYADTQAVLSEKTHTNTYALSKYPRLPKAINFHSWGIDANEYETGLALQSDNILFNTSLYGGVFYNYNNQLINSKMSAYYGRYTAILYGGYAHASDHRVDLQLLETGGIVPLDFSTAKFSKSVSFQMGYMHQQVLIDGTDNYDFSGVHLTISAQNYKLQAKQQVGPTKGISAQLDWKKGMLNKEYDIPDLTIKSNLYLPGVAKTHAIKVQLSQKLQALDGYFMDEMSYSRGYLRPDSSFVSYGKIGLNYQLPLAYPEFGIYSIFYMKRLRLNLFADFSKATIAHYNQTTSNQLYRSAGAELFFDIRWFNRFEAPLFIRYSYCFSTTNKTLAWEFGTPIIVF